jgi:hypothetical protein
LVEGSLFSRRQVNLWQPNSVFAIERYFLLNRRTRRQCGGDKLQAVAVGDGSRTG